MRHRLSFLNAYGGSLAGLALILLTACRPAGNNETVRPNFLVVVSDDQSWLHAGACGCRFVKTPAFDRIASEGMVFQNAFVSAPSCGPSRASLLTGQAFYRMEWASMNHARWPDDTQTYPDRLKEAGYHVGYTGKGWGPGNWKVSGRKQNPAGRAFQVKELDPPAGGISTNDYAGNFHDFLHENENGKPWCFWLGIIEPHRIFEEGAGIRMGKDLDQVEVPPIYPDVRKIRSDLADYANEIDWYDARLAEVLEELEASGELDNTVIIITSDNGMPFPRAKATLYDLGTRVPLAIRWGNGIERNRKVPELISLTDIAPTILELAGLPVPENMTGKSIADLLTDPEGEIRREHVITGLERHYPGSRENSNCYPIRGIRTEKYLFIRNYEPGRMPSGDPGTGSWPPDDPTNGYADTDGSPTKTWIVRHRGSDPQWFTLAFDRRPAEELYEVAEDPHQMNNLAGDPGYAAILDSLRLILQQELLSTNDPRARGEGYVFERIALEYPGDVQDTALLR